MDDEDAKVRSAPPTFAQTGGHFDLRPLDMHAIKLKIMHLLNDVQRPIT